MSLEEIQRRAAQLRAESKKESLVEVRAGGAVTGSGGGGRGVEAGGVEAGCVAALWRTLKRDSCAQCAQSRRAVLLPPPRPRPSSPTPPPPPSQGVIEEVGLIQWPSLGGALLQTLLVIAIVGGTSALLFAVNSALAEISRSLYG